MGCDRGESLCGYHKPASQTKCGSSTRAGCLATETRRMRAGLLLGIAGRMVHANFPDCMVCRSSLEMHADHQAGRIEIGVGETPPSVKHPRIFWLSQQCGDGLIRRAGMYALRGRIASTEGA